MKKKTLLFFLLLSLLNISCVTTKPFLNKPPKPLLELDSPGELNIIDYSKYGEFQNIGTTRYKYRIKKRKGLASAVGEGIFPNADLVKKNREYKKLKAQGRLSGSYWDHVYTSDPVADFFVWATVKEKPGIKLFFTANALKEAGLIMHALKAYQAILIHFPRSACFSGDNSFVWYIAPAAIDKIYALCRRYPELGIKLEGAFFEIKNGNDTNLGNDLIKFDPGRFVKTTKESAPGLKDLKIVEQRGAGKIKLVKYENGHWQMLVNDKSFIIKGITYKPTKIGESPHKDTLRNWMFVDDNGNGLIDAPYESWVDENANNTRDKNEKIVGDFRLLNDMGCNTIRYYHVPTNNKYDKKSFNKELLRDLHYKYGISVIIGDFLGAYTIGSGANWEVGTDYTDKEQCARMKEIIREIVLDHKDEPYVLMWLLGNENNMSGDYRGVNATRTLAFKQPQAYAKFLNEVAEMIHDLDKDHPVAVGNFGTDLIEYYGQYAPQIDILGINYYPDKDGLGALWERVRDKMDRSILITEYGCDTFNTKLKSIDEDNQAAWHKGCWEDIEYNLAGGKGDGNVLGGIVFEWLDEWWKSPHGPEDTQEKTNDCSLAFPDGWSSEEYLGIAAQANGENSPYLRQLRKSYFLYKQLWNN
ncbi:MAG: hypothetical protein L6416_04240 [Candidatus Omnitrophica bacterium]|nr:hypothetical protein [Candidatus Omnitrophota bacterium]